MEKRWELAPPADHKIVDILRNELQLPHVIAQILAQRGFTAAEQVNAFFNPLANALHDPFLFSDMHKAVVRIIKALQEKQRIMVYGDYDVDGITSVSLLYLFFRDLGGDVHYYIPNRQHEGYGISAMGIESAAQEGAKLIITVDCGITSIEEVDRANALGLDMIVSDHHQPGSTLPRAFAILNPKVPGNAYPFTDLAGVGVAYKLAQGVVQELGLNPKYLDRYLDLVAVGTAADIVPLLDENRIFVYLGLEKINSNPQLGNNALIETARLPVGRIEVGQIIYGLAPRMNAVGRLGSAERAVQLMTTTNAAQAMRLARELEEENRIRKEIDQKTLEEATERVEKTFHADRDFAIVIAKENWHSGVIGIVASRLIERYYRPTVMITIEDGIGKGSARSIPGFDLYAALQECTDLLIQFGGHTYAAGLSLKEENIPEFRKQFNLAAAKYLSQDDLYPKLHIDSEIALTDIDSAFMTHLKKFAPFGPSNPRPVFVTYNVELSGYPRVVGRNHLKFQVKSEGRIFDCIGFNLGERITRLDPIRATNNLVFTVEENEWNGQIYLQLRLKDIKSDIL